MSSSASDLLTIAIGATCIALPLLISTIQTAFYEGILNEYEVCKRLNIKPEKLDKYIQ